MGLFDNIDKLENLEGLANVENVIIEEIKDWICKYYSFFPSRSDIARDALNIDTSTCPYIVSCKEAVILDAIKITRNSEFEWELTDGRFIWGEVGGFICSGTPIKSLKGAPKIVYGDFGCAYCQSLESLEGSPEVVYANFICNNCSSLTSLNGVPKAIVGDFDCSYCHSLTSLEGAPKVVRGSFSCNSCKSLTTLEGCPEEVSSLYANNCLMLKYMLDGPKEVYEVIQVVGSYNIKDLGDAIIKYENQLYY